MKKKAEISKSLYNGSLTMVEPLMNRIKIGNILMTIDDVAECLCIKKSTLYSWVFQRKIPFIKIGRLVRFDPLKLAEWLGNKSQEEQNVY